ncbi:MAG: pyrimidine utilization flavin reductase protein F [Beijerinckiaceae bacterium]
MAGEGAIAANRPGEEAWPISDETRAAFRDAMSRVLAAVHIVTTDGPEGKAGITASAVVSVSDDPPTVLFCINKNGRSAARFLGNGCYCVNTLASSDQALADHFAGRTRIHTAERFGHGRWTKLRTGAPVLETALAVFDCRVTEIVTASTHSILIGAVVDARYAPGTSLGYLERAYRHI